MSEQALPAYDTNYADKSDKDSYLDTHRQIRDWWYQARSTHSANRREQSIDANFKDGLQWDERDRAILEERNQKPLTFNEIHPTIEWLCGTERRARTDWSILPRTGDEEANRDAKLKTDIFKFISDDTHYPWERSQAFRDAVTVGVGWLEVGVRGDPSDQPIFIRRDSWRNNWTDPLSVAQIGDDARYHFRSKIIDLDIAIQMWPEHEDALRRAAELRDRWPYAYDDEYIDMQLYYDPNEPTPSRVEDALYWNQNRRTGVRLVEGWYRRPKKVKKLYGKTRFPYKEYDESNEMMRQEVESGVASLYDAIEMEIRVTIFMDRADHQQEFVLQDEPSPYRHKRFPFVPIYAYRRDFDGMPYGVVRNQRDAQEDLNKRRSKFLWILNTRGVIMDNDATDLDEDELAEEVARPDFILRKRRGTELTLHDDLDIATPHVNLELMDKDYIRELSGVTGENMGLDTNATSGRAIRAKQEQGTVITQPLFDNLRLADKVVGEIVLSLVEQFLTGPMVIPASGEGGRQVYREINAEQEDGTILNDITKHRARFVVTEQDWRESIRVAMFESMMNLLGQLPPEASLSLLDMVFEMSDVPEPIKGEWVRRLRQMTGVSDTSEMTEEERMAQQQAMAEKQAEIEEIERRFREAEIANKESQAVERETKALVNQRVAGQVHADALQKAAEALALLASLPNGAGQAASDVVQEGETPSPELVAAAPPGQTAPIGAPEEEPPMDQAPQDRVISPVIRDEEVA